MTNNNEKRNRNSLNPIALGDNKLDGHSWLIVYVRKLYL